MVKKILLFLLLFSCSETLMATHIAGGEITYECLGNNQFLFHLNLYRDCEGVALGDFQSLSLRSTCGDVLNLNLTLTNPGGTEIAQMCPGQIGNTNCNGGVYPGMQGFYFTGTITLNPCDTWTVSWSDCCRNDAIVNLTSPGGDYYYIETTLNSVTAACNNSPTFVNQPIPYTCLNQEVNYSFGVLETDADSVHYSLISARGGVTSPLTYNGIFTFSNPIPGITLDPITGLVNFTPTQTGNYVVVVLVEEYDDQGNLVGSIMRDIQFVVQTCTNDLPVITDGTITGLSGSASQTGPYTLDMCNGSTFSFTATYSDINAADILTFNSNIQDILPGATAVVSGTNPLTVVYTGDLTTFTDLAVLYFQSSIRDNACPLFGQQDFVYRINVLKSVVATQDTTICGTQQALLNATGGTLFNWSVVSGDPIAVGTNFSCNPCANPVATPAITTVYEVVGNLTGTCEIRDTVTVTVATDFTSTLTFQVDSTLCALSEADLTVTNNPADTYTYSWNSSPFLNDTAIATPHVSMTTPGTYTFTYRTVSSSGCTRMDSVTLTSVEIPILNLSGDTMICVGDSSILIASYATNLTDDFNGTLNPDLWANVNGALLNTDCGSVTGNALHFNSATRIAETVALNTNAGGNITFSLIIGNTSSPCDNAEFGEDVVLEYSIDGGATWVLINTYPVDNFTTFTTITENIPPAAMTSNTLFRWRQIVFSGTGSDNWALDDVSINVSNNSLSFTNTWSDGISSLSSSDTLVVKPLAETTYTFTMSNATGCVIRDSIRVHAGPLFTLNTTPDTALCAAVPSLNLVTTPSLMDDYTFSWSPATDLSSTTDSALVTTTQVSQTYAVEAISASGCNAFDTVDIHIAVMPTPFLLGDTAICMGDSTFFYNVTTLAITDNFDGAVINPDLWANVNGALLNTSCGSVTGNALYFNTASNRIAQTISLNAIGGGQITFDLIIGTGASPCEDADGGEDVALEYSIDGGTNWVNINTYLSGNFATFTTVVENIPPAAMTSGTLFRWRQIGFSGTGTDNWALDNVSIQSFGQTSNLKQEWFDGNTLISTSDTLVVFPTANTVYRYVLTDTLANCTRIDSVQVRVGAAFTLTGSPDSTLCDPATLDLVITPSIANDFDFVWTPATGLSSAVDSLVQATISDSAQYVVEVTSIDGCTRYDTLNFRTVVIPTPDILGDTAICLGDSTFFFNPSSVSLSDNFDGTTLNPDLWSTSSGVLVNNGCGSVSGNALYFDNTGGRTAQTLALNTLTGGQITFDLIIGTGSSPCENADGGEDVVLEYSLDGGATWILISNYPADNFASFTNLAVTIPPGAMSSSTIFRWRQVSNSGAGFDNWAMDNVTIQSSGSASDLKQEWFEGNTLISTQDTLVVFPTSNTTYYLVVTDTVSNCSRIDSVQVRVGANFTLNTTADTTFCAPGTMNLITTPSVVNEYDFAWTPTTGLSSATDSLVQANISDSITYQVMVTSSDGCTRQDTVNINLVTLNPPFITGDTTICSGDITQLLMSQQITQQEGFDGTSVDPAIWGNISNGTLGTGCGSVTGNALHFDGTGMRAAQTNPMNTQGGGTITFSLIIGSGSNPCETADGGEDVVLEYSLDGGTTWIVIDTYFTFNFGSFTQVTVNIPTGAMSASTLFRWRQLSNSGGGFDNWAIDDVSFTTGSNTGSGNYTTAWFDGTGQVATGDTISVNPTQNTTYNLVITDQNSGCSISKPVTVYVSQPFTLAVTDDTTVCLGSNITLTGTPSVNDAYTYSWSPISGLSSPNSASTIAIINGPQTYHLIATAPGGCVAEDSVVITTLPAITVTVTGDNQICEGDTTILTATGADSYTWNNSSTLNTNSGPVVSATPGSTTNYIVTGTVGQCTNIGTFTVTVNPAPAISVATPPQLTCLLTSVSLDANSGGNTLAWNGPGISNAADPVSVSAPGTYTVTSTNTTTGCANTASVIVTQASVMDVSFTATPSSGVMPLNVAFTNTSAFASTYAWYFGEDTLLGATTPDAQNLFEQEGTYTVMLIGTNALGCTDTAFATIVVLPLPTGCAQYYIEIPNIITANADQVNDLLTIKHDITGSFGYNCIILNRWGNVVYESTDINQPWDGRSQKGELCSEGVYFYKVIFTCDGEETLFHGSIQLAH